TMKKTVKINLSGSIFHIDEDAYQRLNDYLDKIHEHFKGQEGGEEIISDIEMRMAELFHDKLSGHKQVISDADVREVTKKMGEPNDFLEEEESAQGTGGSQRQKKLYRDPDQAILGGVASGIGAYLNVDPVWIRLLLVVLMLGYGFIAVVYILLWLFIPKATTYDQKLEMRGEHGDIPDIEKRVKEEYEQVRGNFKKYRQSGAYQNITRALNEIFVVFGRLLKAILEIVLVLIGVALVIAGIGLILGLVGIPFIAWPFNMIDLFDHEGTAALFIFQSMLDSTAFVLLAASVAVLVAIPILVIFYTGLKLLSGFRAKDQKVLLSALIIWVAALLLTAGTAAWQVHEFTVRSHTSEEVLLEPEGSSTLVVQMHPPQVQLYEPDDMPLEDDIGVIRGKDVVGVVRGTDPEGNLYINTEIDIIKSPDESYHLHIKKSSRGSSISKAAGFAEKIGYNWKMEDSTLVLDNTYKVERPTPYRLQKMNLVILVPEGKRIAISKEAEEYLDDADNRENMWPFEMGGKIWQMQGDELTLPNKSD
ncbi:MAG TPA: PspC domain-containing protein, partial [Bacteroidales bacterium]|nr:PspC domain-containing protein [Bacteroidales bacterium]